MAVQESFINVVTNTPSSGVTKFPIAPPKIRGLIPAWGGLMSVPTWQATMGVSVPVNLTADDYINSASLAIKSSSATSENFPNYLGTNVSLNTYYPNTGISIAGSWEDLFVDGVKKTKAAINGYRTDSNITPYPWSFAQFGDAVIATNLGYTPQVYSISGGGAFVDLIASTDKPHAKFCTIVGQHLVLANIYMTGAGDGGAIPAGVNENLVWWSRSGDHTRFGSPTSDPGNNTDYQQLYEISGAITGIAGGADRAVIFKEYGIYLMQLTGGPGLFSFQPIIVGTGCINPRSICVYGSDIFFLSQNGYAVLKDMSAFQLIIDKNINPDFFLWALPDNPKSDYMSKQDATLYSKQ